MCALNTDMWVWRQQTYVAYNTVSDEELALRQCTANAGMTVLQGKVCSREQSAGR